MKLGFLRALGAGLVGTVFLVAGAGPGSAGPRGPGDPFEVVRPTTNPLAVYLDNIRRGDASISYRLANLSTGLKSQSAWKLKDTHQDGNLVHGTMITMVNTGLCYAPEYLSCSKEYYSYDDAETLGWGGTYRSNWMYVSTGISTSGTYARLSGKMCVTQGNWPDECDGYAISSGWRY